MLEKAQVPAHDASIDPSNKEGKKLLLNRATNSQAYTNLLLLCMNDVSFGVVDKPTTDKLPDGNA